jgi:hypothetical protein
MSPTDPVTLGLMGHGARFALERTPHHAVMHPPGHAQLGRLGHSPEEREEPRPLRLVGLSGLRRAADTIEHEHGLTGATPVAQRCWAVRRAVARIHFERGPPKWT